jgi:alkaline phosphatase D
MMKRIGLLLFVAGLVAAIHLPRLACGAVGYTSGVASGDVTETGVILWTRVDQAAELLAQVALDTAFQQVIQSVSVMVGPETDFTVRVDVGGLQPATRYFYRFLENVPGAGITATASATGTFRTAPPAGQLVDVRFAYSGDSDARLQPFTVLGAVQREAPEFFVYLGDTIYADATSAAGNVTQVPPAETLPIYRAKYRENRQDAFLQSLLASTSSYVIWDDHEVLDNFAGETVDPTLLVHGRQAFLEYMPIRSEASDPTQLFRRFRWGQAVELFIVDERQYRSAEAVCLTESGHRVLVPFVHDPTCVRERLAAPGRSLLGSQQQAWLFRQLAASEAIFKVIINEVPISQLFILPYDRWEGYLVEREALLQFIERAGIRNVVFLTTDLHGSLIVDVTPLGRVRSVAKEVIVGPIATLSALATQGISDPELRAARARLGLPHCLHLNTFSYGLVEVDPHAQPPLLTVTVKNQDGQPLVDPVTRQVCRIAIPAEE